MTGRLKPGLSLGSRPSLSCMPSILSRPRCQRQTKLLVLGWVKEKVETTAVRQADLESVKRANQLLHKTSLRRRQAPGVSNITRFKRRGRQKQADPKASAEAALQPPVPVPDTGKLFPLKGWPFPGAHKPLGLVAVSAHILGTACQLTEVPVQPCWMPCVVGAAMGGMFALLNRFGMRRFWRAPTGPLNVVITGATRGLGKALAREFLRAGDRVVVSSRSPISVRKVTAELRDEVDPEVWLMGVDCNVSSPGNVHRLADAARSALGTVDVWINNAGYSGSFQAFLDATPEQVQEVVATNLTGSLLCTKRAMQLMASQKTRGHIFNMDGAGADLAPTPRYAAYGATKAGIAHLMGSLSQEARQQQLPISIHTLSPGMVLTNLLLEGASGGNKAVFNILCEQPETVAAFLVPRVRTVVARQSASSYIRFLTPQRAIARFLLAPFHVHRFFDSAGRPQYAGEYERIMGQNKLATKRRANRFARRSRALVLAYSTTMAASYLLLMAHALSQTAPTIAAL